MAANVSNSKNGEISMLETKKSGDVVVMVSGQEKDVKNSPRRLSSDSHFEGVRFAPMGTPSPDNARFAPSPNRPPKIPTKETTAPRKALARSVYSKPKSRFGEQPISVESYMLEEDSNFMQDCLKSSGNSPARNMSTQASPNSRAASAHNSFKDINRNASMNTPRTPLMASPGGVLVDEDEEIYKKVSNRNKLKYKKVKNKVLIEWLVFLVILGSLISCLTIDKLEHTRIWGLELWKWCLLVLVTISGMLFTTWFMHFVVLVIEMNYLFKKKVLYFVHGLKKSAQVCLWWTLILITWLSLFNNGVHRSATATRVLDYITWTIVSVLICSFLWLFKTLLLKMLASSFHVNTFFDRVQESIFHQYVLQILSGPPLLEQAGMLGRANSASQFSFRSTKKGKPGKDEAKKAVIDINKLHQIKQEKVSAWTMKILVDVISNSGLSTISSSLDETDYYGNNEQTDKEITSEMEAIAAAYHIYGNVAQPGSKYIDELDLRRFMLKEEVDLVFPLIDVGETGQIDKKALTEWVDERNGGRKMLYNAQGPSADGLHLQKLSELLNYRQNSNLNDTTGNYRIILFNPVPDAGVLKKQGVKVYNGRKALAHALNDTKTAVKQLNTLVTVILIVIICVVWLLLVEIATTKVLLFLSSQLVAAAFLFGNTCKTIFEAIIFVFVMHPFDVGDRCVIDGVQMIVEEMNILTTVFLRYDMEKIYYPNSVLATKPISNFYRSPDMGDSLEFSICFRTPVEKIGSLREKIKKYLERTPQYWHPNHNMVVKEIENVNKIKMALFFNHTMNFQEFGEKNRRRSELVMEMKKIFEELGIKYNLLPQEVQVVNSDATR